MAGMGWFCNWNNRLMIALYISDFTGRLEPREREDGDVGAMASGPMLSQTNGEEEHSAPASRMY